MTSGHPPSGAPGDAAGARLAVIGVFVGFGAVLGAWSGTVPAIARAAGIGKLGLGLGMSGFMIALVVAMALAGRLARRTTCRRILMAVLPALGLACWALHAVQSPPAFFAALVLLGFTFGLTDVFMNTEGTSVEADLGRPVYLSFHALLSVSLGVFALAGSLVAAAMGPATAGALAALATLLAAAGVAAWTPERGPAPARPAVGGTGQPVDGRLVALGLAAGLVMSCEISALVWSARRLDELAPALASVAGTGAAFYALCNAVLRFAGDGLRRRHGDRALMQGSLVVAVAGFLALGVVTSFAANVAVFALIGAGLACVVPAMFALAAGRDPSRRAEGLSLVATVAGGPRILAPWLFGWVAEAWSTAAAFALSALLLMAALALVRRV